MNYQIVLTPYLNNRPFFYHTSLGNCELVQISPRESIKALNDGSAQAGVIPVAGLKLLGDQFKLLGNFGVASEGTVRSVLFFSRLPFDRFTSANTIKLSNESITSINLLGLLFGYQRGFNNLPQLTNDHNIFDGELLIGDRALERLQQGEDLFVTDLSERWTQYHQLPFVFARWVIHKNASKEFHVQLKEWLTTFVENEKDLQQVTAEREALLFNMASEQIMDYLQGIKTWIGEREQIGQTLYLAELEKHRPVFERSNKYLRKQYA
jgi:chorismate dehydratase